MMTHHSLIILSISSGETPDLYTVVPEKSAGIAGRTMMGSSHVYDIAAVSFAQVVLVASHERSVTILIFLPD